MWTLSHMFWSLVTVTLFYNNSASYGNLIVVKMYFVVCYIFL